MTFAASLIGLHAIWQLEVAVRLAFMLTVICGAALAALRLLPRHAARARHRVLSLALVGVLAAPCAMIAMPALPIVYSLPQSMAHVDNLPRLGAGRASVAAVLGAGDAAAAPGSSARDPGPLAWLALTWLVGAGLLVARFTRDRKRMWRKLGALQTVAEPVGGLLRDGVATFGVRAPVRVLEAERAPTPLTFGHVRPTIVLPRSAVSWSDDTTRAVLWHELAHVRRGDWLRQAIGLAACVAFWFHPLVWYVAARQREEAELAADAEAVGAGIRPSAYARALVSVAARERPPGRGRATHAGGLALAPGSRLEARLCALRDALRSAGKAGSSRRQGSRLAIAGLLLATALSALAAPVLDGGCWDHEPPTRTRHAAS